MAAQTVTVIVGHQAQLGPSNTEIVGTLLASDAHSVTIERHDTGKVITISRQHICRIRHPRRSL